MKSKFAQNGNILLHKVNSCCGHNSKEENICGNTVLNNQFDIMMIMGSKLDQ